MNRKEEEIDRLYDMFSEGYIPTPIKVLIILFAVFFGPILIIIDKISEKSDKM